MKKIVLVIIFLIGLTSLAESQTRLKFGNVFLKDTLSGDMFLKTGALYVTDSIIMNSNVLKFNVNPAVSDVYFKSSLGTFLTLDNTTLTSSKAFSAPGLTSTSNATFNDNVTIDSILTTRTSGVIGLVSDDSLITITSSVMMISSDNGTATNRTFTISDGATVGQTLTIILWESGGTDKCELVDDANVGGLNGTMTFDADMDNVSLIWYGIWIELARVEH